MKNNYFGHNLKVLRKSFNLSQQQLARIVGKTFTAVSRWEAGLRDLLILKKAKFLKKVYVKCM